MVNLDVPVVECIQPDFIDQILAHIEQGQQRITLTNVSQYWVVGVGYICNKLKRRGFALQKLRQEIVIQMDNREVRLILKKT